MVLALFGVIAAIIIPTVGKVRETAQRSVEVSERRQREMMLELVRRTREARDQPE